MERRMPWLAVAALVAATASGMLHFWVGGAPLTYVVLNGLSLLLGLVIVLVPMRSLAGRVVTGLVGIGVAGIAATLLSGFDLEGVRRWLPIGPIRLHAAMLLLPAIMVLLPRLSGAGQIGIVTALAAIFAIQPDLGAALALAAAFLFSRVGRGEHGVTAIGAAASIAAVAITSLRPDPLDPVAFVERVVPDAFATSAMLGLLIGTTLLFACAAPLFVQPRNARATRSLAGVMAGFTLASTIGPYPVPLSGYGASSILGYALALAVLRASIVPSKAG
jgi:hypothetical protein